MHSAPVNKIIPFSAVDGPGNRTAVFTQSCNFDCLYCHNPETISLCRGCGGCAGCCPTGALSREDGRMRWNPALCCHCDACLKACRHSSSPRIRQMTAQEVMDEINPVLPFIEGLTVSGGECTLWPQFMTELFLLARQSGKTAFADTNGFVDFAALPELVATMDSAMIDLKAADNGEHRMLTGKSNETVLSNIAYLASIGKLFEIRTVIVPGLLDNRRTVELGSALIARYPAVRYKLIRYRPMGVRADKLSADTPPDSLMEELAALASAKGVRDIVII